MRVSWRSLRPPPTASAALRPLVEAPRTIGAATPNCLSARTKWSDELTQDRPNTHKSNKRMKLFSLRKRMDALEAISHRISANQFDPAKPLTRAEIVVR